MDSSSPLEVATKSREGASEFTALKQLENIDINATSEMVSNIKW